MQGAVKPATTAKLVALERFLLTTFHFSSRRCYLIAQRVKCILLQHRIRRRRLIVVKKISTGRT